MGEKSPIFRRRILCGVHISMVLLALGAFVLRLSPDTVEGEKYRYLSPSTGRCILLYNIPVAVLDEAADGDVER